MAPAWTETQNRCDVAFGTTPITFFGLEWQERRVRSKKTDAATRRHGDTANLPDPPLTRLGEHFDQLGHDLVISVIEFFKLFLADVTALACELQPNASFFGFLSASLILLTKCAS
jgi:hypothetical protein